MGDPSDELYGRLRRECGRRADDDAGFTARAWARQREKAAAGL
ncbi:hypothetical protein ACFQ7B_20250 [Streptomyces erythrochromogenes]